MVSQASILARFALPYSSRAIESSLMHNQSVNFFPRTVAGSLCHRLGLLVNPCRMIRNRTCYGVLNIFHPTFNSVTRLSGILQIMRDK